jgi:opacity protein-like surface antigen
MARAVLLGLGSGLTLSLLAGAAVADGPPRVLPKQLPALPFSWTGLYLGTHTGGALDESDVSNPFGPTLFGDEVRSPGPLAGIQLGYNQQYGAMVVGIEADVSWADLDGTFTCLQPARGLPGGPFGPAFTGGAFGATCRVQADWLGTLTGRVGTTLGPDGRLLIYAKGGLAWIHADIEMATNNILAGEAGPPTATSRSSFTQWGWTVGAGLEYALVGNWSARLEYDFLSFGDHDLATPQASPIAMPDFPGILGSSAPDGRRASVDQDVHAIKLGLNYRFGSGAGPWSPAGIAGGAPVPRALQVEVGGRYVHGWGRFKQDLQGSTGLPANNSRLTWDNLKTDGAEVFWRVDTPHRLMVKGLWGRGTGDEGRINDEDWGLDERDPPEVGALVSVQPYQNTISAVDSSIRYFTIDVGYNWLAGAGYKLSPFVGYNYFRQEMDAFGITNVNFSPPIQEAPHSVLPLQQFATWDSLRLGTAVELWLTPGLRLSAEAAWLSYVHLDGTDNHPLRVGEGPSTRSPQDGNGTGVQLEAALTYNLTDQFSIGVGGRYWAMWVSDGKTDSFSTGELARQRFAAEQAALFVQGSYKFDVPCCAWMLLP